MFGRWFKKTKTLLAVPFYKQDTEYTCGPTSLQMVLSFFGVRQSEKDLARLAQTELSGTAHDKMVLAVTELGFYAYVNSEANLEEVKYFLNLGLPVVVNYTEPSTEDGHYAVAVGYDRDSIILHDPWNGPYFTLKQDEFVRRWYDNGKHASRHWLLAVADKPFSLGRQYVPQSAIKINK